jgi:hypothetical protein
LGAQLARDESLDHLDGAIGLGTRLNDPAVIGSRIDL